jgi:hypothetical protein
MLGIKKTKWLGKFKELWHRKPLFSLALKMTVTRALHHQAIIFSRKFSFQ